ncbi:MAG: hypothetical protein AABX11_07545 [Nanoarchaeota archaeon]
MNLRKRLGLGILIFVVLAILLLFSIRLFGVKEIDDVNPLMCNEEDWEYIEKSDVLWVVPLFENVSIANNSEWVGRIKGMNKSLGLHGVYHKYNEFGVERDREYLNLGIREFEEAFEFTPRMFKAPQLNLSWENRALLIGEGFEIREKLNQITHKVYHCNDSGMFKNWVIDLF